MEGRCWEEVQILSCKKYVKSIIAGNNSIHALSKVHQPAAARSCIQRVCGISQNDYSITGTAGHSISGAVDVSTRFSNTRYFFHAASNAFSSSVAISSSTTV
nr:MAG TPA: hypothetical protein [Caudoviricetes sp.]